ncbi:LOW QUALITY PROTEIN: tRNA wybutosine-synthesizing protein 4-like [Haliotis rubra]|uniref:LOW QUALITY PROTEIN: tRNA wybutosine-synthesizing protein 4-like n=1 Tax=Haliotis rubra TaxID=36100 RepID=UPI001EE5F16D|nr:LOW QUALITY PROTEIN: tRNA wybutosine-synthesizing protein 4-like [Haliotis rubra]
MDGKSSTKKKGKTAKTRRETAVQGTNDHSIVSKCSMAGAGYFQDDFLKFFVAKTSRRAPLIHRGYYIRAKTVSVIVNEFLQRHGSKPKQIVSLGSGFDSAYFRMKSAGQLQNAMYIEIDFPEVVKRKNAIIKNTSELSDLLGEELTLEATSPHIEINRHDYKMLGVDLTQLNTLEAALRLCQVDFDAPTLLLSEVVLTYMTRRCASAVVKWAAETFSDGAFLIYEQINPNDPFGLFMQKHYKVIGSPLKCINAFPTLQSQVDRFVSLGWNWCEAYDMNQFYKDLVGQKEKVYINSLEPFDEYEEMHLKCSHYFVLCAYSTPRVGLLQENRIMQVSADDSYSKSKPENVPELVKVLPPKEDSNAETSSIKRFSHTSSRVDEHFIATVGGFGEQDGRHQRISEVKMTNVETLNGYSIKTNNETLEMARMHHSLDVLEDGTLVLFGGRISPYRLCSQLIKLKLTATKKDSNSSLNETETGVVSNAQTDLVNKLATCDIDTGNICSKANIQKASCDTSGGACVTEDTDLQPPAVPHNMDHKSDVNSDNEPQCLKEEDKMSISDSVHHKKSKKGARIQKKGGHPIKKGGNSKNVNSEVEKGDNSCRDWSFDMESSVLEQKGDVPCLRWRHATTRVTIKGEEMVLLYGGRNSTDAALQDCYLLNPKTGVWKQVDLEGENPGCRQSHTLTSWGDKMILYGGLNEFLLPHNTVYCLDLPTLTWKRISVTGALQPRYSHTCHVTDNMLVVIGGVNLSHGTPGVALLDLHTGKCVEYDLPSAEKDNLKMFHKHSSVSIADGQFLIIGGGGNCFSFGSHLNASPFLLDISLCLQHFVQNA